MDNIIEKILKARADYVTANHERPNKCRISSANAADLKLTTEFRNAFVGLHDRELLYEYGMDIYEDAAVADIICERESER